MIETSRRSFRSDRFTHTGLPLLGYFGVLRELDHTTAGRLLRMQIAAIRSLAAARAKTAPSFEARVYDDIPQLEAARLEDSEPAPKTYEVRPGDKLGDLDLPPGVWTPEAIVEEINARSILMRARFLGGRVIGVAPVEADA